MGNGEWGMGKGEWGMGKAEWGMGNEGRGMGNEGRGIGNEDAARYHGLKDHELNASDERNEDEERMDGARGSASTLGNAQIAGLSTHSCRRP